MARIKKFATEQNLTNFKTFIVDEKSDSEYFRITDFSDTLTGGKNGFLIEGSEYLMESTELKIELTDVNDNPIYYEPGDGIPEYYEGISKVVSIHIYNDTPIGLGKITILGELKEYEDNGVKKTVPFDWRGTYNVKWERTFQVNKNLSNEDKVRFYRRPKVNIEEIIKPIFVSNPDIITQTGSVDGVSLVPSENTKLNQFSLPTSYLLKINTGSHNADTASRWTGSAENQTIEIEGLNYSPTITEIVNDTELVVSTPYADNNVVKSFKNKPYSLNFPYREGSISKTSGINGSFAKIDITDMKTFVGDAARMKVFRKSQSNLTDYEFVQEVQLESTELLKDVTRTDVAGKNYGFFTEDILNAYWSTSSSDLNTVINQDVLYNSVKLDNNSSENQHFYTSETISIQKDVEYTTNFNLKLGNNNTGGSVSVFLSGSDGIVQPITTIQASNNKLQNIKIDENIIADTTQEAQLYFEVIGIDWYINNISFKASEETSFSPDEISFIQQTPLTSYTETFDYKFELYDINNNYIPIKLEADKTFEGVGIQVKDIDITVDSQYFPFNSASVPSEPLPPYEINFSVKTPDISGSITYTSGAYDINGDLIPSQSYAGIEYPGKLNEVDISGIDTTDDYRFKLSVDDFTGSRDDIQVQYIKYTAEAEGESDTVIITKVEDGKGGLDYEIIPFNGTVIKNKGDKVLEIQAVKSEGTDRENISSNLDDRFSEAKLHIISSSIEGGSEVTTYVSLSQAINDGFITGVGVGKTGSGEIDYNATFNRDAITDDLTLYLMNGPTSESILSSIILVDLRDGLSNGVISSTTNQFNISYDDGELSEYSATSSIITASFQPRDPDDEPLTFDLTIIPSSSVEPKSKLPHYFMYYETGSSDDTIELVVTDSTGSIINNGISEVVEDKQLNLEFTYTEPVTDTKVTTDKSFFITPAGLPGQDAIVVDIDSSPITLNTNPKGEVYSYGSATGSIKVKQGELDLINTASGEPGTFTTTSVVGDNINIPTMSGESSTTMSLGGFSDMTDISASIDYELSIHPYFTESQIVDTKTQRFTKVLKGGGAVDLQITPNPVLLSANENGYIEPSSYVDGDTQITVEQDSEFLIYTASKEPGTFFVRNTQENQGIVGNNIQTGLVTVSTDKKSLNVTGLNGFSVNLKSASIDYEFEVYPYALDPENIGEPKILNKTQKFSKVNDGETARKVSLTADTNVVNYSGDGVRVSPTGSIELKAISFNTTGNVDYEFTSVEGNSEVIIGNLGGNINETNQPAVVTIPNGKIPRNGESIVFKVKLRDNQTNEIRDIDLVTISGVKNGGETYVSYLSNPVTSVNIETDQTLNLNNTSTTIQAFKGPDELEYIEIFSEPTRDSATNEIIGSFGEFSASIDSKSDFITMSANPISKDGISAVTTNIQDWNSPNTNTSGFIRYKLDIENGRQIQYIEQSISVVINGETGPGVVLRGEWSNDIPYEFLTNPTPRKDVVYRKVSGDTHYWATTRALVNTPMYASGSSINPYTNQPQIPSPPDVGKIENNWEYLGTQDYFVAAKIAIFEESFVENTINVGIPSGSNNNSQISIVGGTTKPYISIGQGGTQGYTESGIYLGIGQDVDTDLTGQPLVSFTASGSQPNYFRYDNSGIQLKGDIRASTGNIGGWEIENDVLKSETLPNGNSRIKLSPSDSLTPIGSLGYNDGSSTPIQLSDDDNNRVEITPDGIQVISNSSTFVRLNRFDTGNNDSNNLELFRAQGGFSVFRPYEVNPNDASNFIQRTAILSYGHILPGSNGSELGSSYLRWDDVNTIKVNGSYVVGQLVASCSIIHGTNSEGNTYVSEVSSKKINDVQRVSKGVYEFQIDKYNSTKPRYAIASGYGRLGDPSSKNAGDGEFTFNVGVKIVDIDTVVSKAKIIVNTKDNNRDNNVDIHRLNVLAYY